MANLAIIDTGFIKVDKSGTKETDLANDGTELTLSVTSTRRQRGVGFDDTPIPGLKTEQVEVNLVSVTNTIYSLSCIMDREVLDSDVDYLDQVDRLQETNGVKLLFDSTTQFGKGADQAANIKKTFIDSFGDKNKDDSHTGTGNELPAGTPHLHVVATGLGPLQDATNSQKINFTLTLEETG